MTLPRAILVMGVCGAGKTTLGRALADRLGYAFIEGDDLHSAANVAKMAAGTPLTDEDRAPWLERVADALADAATRGGGVVACSALKRRYRDLLRNRSRQALAIVHPLLADGALLDRLARREGHFMPPGLLASQQAALEPPAPDEHACTIDAARPLGEQVASAIALLGGDLPGAPGRTA